MVLPAGSDSWDPDTFSFTLALLKRGKSLESGSKTAFTQYYGLVFGTAGHRYGSVKDVGVLSSCKAADGLRQLSLRAGFTTLCRRRLRNLGDCTASGRPVSLPLLGELIS